jgi:hypothetical protein
MQSVGPVQICLWGTIYTCTVDVDYHMKNHLMKQRHFSGLPALLARCTDALLVSLGISCN